HLRRSESVLYRLQYGVYIQEYRTSGKLYHRVCRRAPQSADSRLPVIQPANNCTEFFLACRPVDVPVIRAKLTFFHRKLKLWDTRDLVRNILQGSSCKSGAA